MTERQLRRTENAKKAAQEDLVETDAQAAKVENGGGSFAARRQGRVICDIQWDQDDSYQP